MKNVKILDNKLTIVSSLMPYMESVAIGVWIGMGGRYEDKKWCGISHFIEHMLFKGTHSRDAKQLKQSVEGIGGHFNGFTSEEVTCYLIKVPAKHMLLGIDILSDMVLHPKMEDNEIEKERQVIKEEIKMYRDQPSSFVHEILSGLMWPRHPLGRPLTGFEETVSTMDRKNLMTIKEKFYQPSNVAIVVTGKIEETKLLEGVKEVFQSTAEKKTPGFTKFKRSQKEKKIKVHFKDTEQTHIAMGFHGIGRKSKDRYALSLLNIILGGNMSSRLFEELREKRGLCYDVSSSMKKYEETGAFFIHAGVDNRKVEETLRIIMSQLSMIRTLGVCEDELNRAKEFYKGQLLLALEDTGARMLWLGDKVMTREGIPTIKDILKDVEKVTTNDICKVASEIFRVNEMSLAAIGPKRRLKQSRLEKLMVIK